MGQHSMEHNVPGYFGFLWASPAWLARDGGRNLRPPFRLGSLCPCAHPPPCPPSAVGATSSTVHHTYRLRVRDRPGFISHVNLVHQTIRPHTVRWPSDLPLAKPTDSDNVTTCQITDLHLQHRHCPRNVDSGSGRVAANSPCHLAYCAE
jgi:hypothetical protein